MIESWVGVNAFQKGVNAYLERFQYGNASAEDFWMTIAKVTGKPVDKVMPTFVDRPGVPLVTVRLACSGEAGKLTLEQERYEVAKDNEDRTTNLEPRTTASDPRPAPRDTWQIPVCLHGPDGKPTCELADEKAESVSLNNCPSWVVANAGARGYYRSALPPEMIRTLAPDVVKLPPAERLALLSDEWALVNAARHDIGTYLDLASGFKTERNPTVMRTLANTLRTIGEDLTTDRTREPFRTWVAELLTPALDDVGFAAKPGDDDATRELRAVVVGALGYTARDSGVLAKAREVVDQELAKPGSVDPTLLNVVVNLAALTGDGSLYEKYLGRTRAATHPEERYLFLYGLAAFGNPELVRRTMDLTIGPAVRSQDAKLVIRNLLTNPEARELAWDLTRERWADIQKKTGEFVGNSLIVGGLGSFCDAESRTEIESFFAAHTVPDAARTLKQSLEQIASCVRLAEGQREKLAAWLAGKA
jgi:aminopeptidase N